MSIGLYQTIRLQGLAFGPNPAGPTKRFAITFLPPSLKLAPLKPYLQDGKFVSVS